MGEEAQCPRPGGDQRRVRQRDDGEDAERSGGGQEQDRRARSSGDEPARQAHDAREGHRGEQEGNQPQGDGGRRMEPRRQRERPRQHTRVIEVRERRMSRVEDVVRLLGDDLEERADGEPDQLQEDQHTEPSSGADHRSSLERFRSLHGFATTAASGVRRAASTVPALA
jgi:hypothetical protein